MCIRDRACLAQKQDLPQSTHDIGARRPPESSPFALGHVQDLQVEAQNTTTTMCGNLGLLLVGHDGDAAPEALLEEMARVVAMRGAQSYGSSPPRAASP